MGSQIQAIVSAWSPPVGLTAAVLIVCAIYVRGWMAIRKTRRLIFAETQLAFFLCGMTVLWLAIASPIDGFADVLLTAHMLQHFLLMSIVPPLILLSAPVVPLLRGLPGWMVLYIAGPPMRWCWSRWIGHAITLPVIAWLAFNLVFLGWHMPVAYDFALRNEYVHDFEHICFLGTSLLFWYIVLRPWPSRVKSNGWMLLLYLLSADIVNTALSGFLVFCNRPIYQFYVESVNPFGISPLADQIAAGAMMWVLNSIVFLVPAMLLTMQLAGFGSQRQRSAKIAAGTFSI